MAAALAVTGAGLCARTAARPALARRRGALADGEPTSTPARSPARPVRHRLGPGRTLSRSGAGRPRDAVPQVIVFVVAMAAGMIAARSVALAHATRPPRPTAKVWMSFHLDPLPVPRTFSAESLTNRLFASSSLRDRLASCLVSVDVLIRRAVTSAPSWLGDLSPQRHHLAAVDDDGRAGDVAAGVGREQQQRAVEIAVLAEAADRDVARQRLAAPRSSDSRD